MVNHRKSIVHGLIPPDTDRLLDVGCGPILSDYAYADRAKSVLCVDWNLVKSDNVPLNVECVSGNFVELDFPEASFDIVIAADVFEHVQMEDESRFIEKCISALRPNGCLIISVPNRGTYAWLDPYEVKPLIDRVRYKLGLLKTFHNGNCDIRKGHKHYELEEIKNQFSAMKLEKVVYWGYVYDPLLTWSQALFGYSSNSPIIRWLEDRVDTEITKNYGSRSFNMALVLKRPVAD